MQLKVGEKWGHFPPKAERGGASEKAWKEWGHLQGEAKNVAAARWSRASTFFVFTLHRKQGRVIRLREAITLIFVQSVLTLG